MKQITDHCRSLFLERAVYSPRHKPDATGFTLSAAIWRGADQPGMIVVFIQRSNLTMPRTKDELTIQVVNSRARLKEFIELPQALYQHDPNWVKPLYLEQKERFSKKTRFFSTPAGRPGSPDEGNARSDGSALRSMNSTCSATRTGPDTSAAWRRKMMRMFSRPCLRRLKTGLKPKACIASPGRLIFPSTKSAGC